MKLKITFETEEITVAKVIEVVTGDDLFSEEQADEAEIQLEEVNKAINVGRIYEAITDLLVDHNREQPNTRI